MFDFTKLNAGKVFTFDIGKYSREKLNDEKMEYRAIKDLPKDVVYTLVGFFENTHSKYGKSYTAITTDNGEMFWLTNLPSHMNKTIEKIMEDESAVEAVNAGKCAVKIVEYTSHGRDCVTFEFC